MLSAYLACRFARNEGGTSAGYMNTFITSVFPGAETPPTAPHRCHLQFVERLHR